MEKLAILVLPNLIHSRVPDSLLIYYYVVIAMLFFHKMEVKCSILTGYDWR